MTTPLLFISWIAAAIAVMTSLVVYRNYKRLRDRLTEAEQLNQVNNQQRDLDHQQQLQQLQDQSSQAQKKQTTFIASAAHDLRQPLHALSLFSDALLNQSLDSGTQDIAVKIKRSVTALVELFNTLFDVSKLEAGTKPAKVRDFPLQQIFQVLDAEYAPQAQIKGLKWHCDSAQFNVRSDPALLETILRNLISNAMRYTQQGGIGLHAKSADGMVHIGVSDTGIGIPKQQQQEIFQEFHQLGGNSRSTTTGLGLGLSIVERLIKLLGHRIDVKSEVGKGTTFTLTVAEGGVEEGEAVQPGTAVVHDLTGLRTLVIDDDPQVRDSMQSLLQSWQCQVTLAGTEHEVYDLLIKQRISLDAIVSDYQLTKQLDGLRLLEAVLPETGLQVPVLFVSGVSSEDIINKVRASGYHFLPKPVVPAQLRAFLRNAARQKSTNLNNPVNGDSMRLQSFPVPSLINRFVAEYRAQAQEKGIEFDYDCNSVTVDSDTELLETIVRNLLNFAFKRTTHGSVRLHCLDAQDSVLIEISDSGKPPSPQTQQRLRQYQSNPAAVDETSFNLGLSLAFRLAQSLNHQIRLDDTQNTGLTFQILIPRRSSR